MFTQEEIEAMRLADAEIEQEFSLTLDEIAESKERDNYVIDGQLDFKDLRRQQYQRAYNKRYYTKNKERLNAKSKEYRADHKDEVRRKEAEWKRRNADYSKTYQKAYYNEKRELICIKKQGQYEVDKAYKKIMAELEGEHD